MSFYNSPFGDFYLRTEIPYFSGDHVEWWIYHVECFFYGRPTIPEQKLRLGEVYFIGEALQWYREWDWNARRSWRMVTWETFVMDLTARFKVPDIVESRALVLNSISKQLNELSHMLDKMITLNSVYRANLSKMKLHINPNSISSIVENSQTFEEEQSDVQEEMHPITRVVENDIHVNGDLADGKPVFTLVALPKVTSPPISVVFLSASLCTATASDLEVNGKLKYKSEFPAVSCSEKLCSHSVRQNAYDMSDSFLPPAKPPDEYLSVKVTCDTSGLVHTHIILVELGQLDVQPVRWKTPGIDHVLVATGSKIQRFYGNLPFIPQVNTSPLRSYDLIWTRFHTLVNFINNFAYRDFKNKCIWRVSIVSGDCHKVFTYLVALLLKYDENCGLWCCIKCWQVAVAVALSSIQRKEFVGTAKGGFVDSVVSFFCKCDAAHVLNNAEVWVGVPGPRLRKLIKDDGQVKIYSQLDACSDESVALFGKTHADNAHVCFSNLVLGTYTKNQRLSKFKNRNHIDQWVLLAPGVQGDFSWRTYRASVTKVGQGLSSLVPAHCCCKFMSHLSTLCFVNFCEPKLVIGVSNGEETQNDFMMDHCQWGFLIYASNRWWFQLWCTGRSDFLDEVNLAASEVFAIEGSHSSKMRYTNPELKSLLRGTEVILARTFDVEYKVLRDNKYDLIIKARMHFLKIISMDTVRIMTKNKYGLSFIVSRTSFMLALYECMLPIIAGRSVIQIHQAGFVILNPLLPIRHLLLLMISFTFVDCLKRMLCQLQNTSKEGLGTCEVIFWAEEFLHSLLVNIYVGVDKEYHYVKMMVEHRNYLNVSVLGFVMACIKYKTRGNFTNYDPGGLSCGHSLAIPLRSYNTKMQIANILKMRSAICPLQFPCQRGVEIKERLSLDTVRFIIKQIKLKLSGFACESEPQLQSISTFAGICICFGFIGGAWSKSEADRLEEKENACAMSFSKPYDTIVFPYFSVQIVDIAPTGCLQKIFQFEKDRPDFQKMIMTNRSCANFEFIWFSLPRPPEFTDLEDKVILKDGGMLCIVLM